MAILLVYFCVLEKELRRDTFGLGLLRGTYVILSLSHVVKLLSVSVQERLLGVFLLQLCQLLGIVTLESRAENIWQYKCII